MFAVMRCTSAVSSIYFVMLIIIGGIILMNLFLAIMLGNFDKAKFFGQKKKVFEAYKELLIEQKDKRYTFFWACDKILGDFS
jgi:hypothetical protein